MSFTLERLIAYGTDVLGFVVLPNYLTNKAIERAAKTGLKKAIQDKCGDAGAVNEADLQKQMDEALKIPRFQTYRTPGFKFPEALPGLGGKSFPRIPFFTHPSNPYVLSLLGVYSDHDVAYSVPLYLGLFAYADAQRGSAIMSQLPGFGKIPIIKNGKFQKTINDFDIQCKGPSNPGVDPDEVLEAEEVTNPGVQAAPDANASQMSIFNPFETSFDYSQMVCTADPSAASSMESSAQIAGIPGSGGSLAAQINSIYGGGTPPSDGTPGAGPGGMSLSATPQIGTIPILSTAPIGLPQIKPITIPVARPVVVP
ncbi:MAG: hypothetical protein U1F57_12160 [bacterium]